MLRWLSISALLVLLVGCASTPKQPPHQLTGDPIVDGEYFIANGPPRDKVLWQYRTALADMRRGRFDQAKVQLDDALSRIGNIIGTDKDAAKSRGYFTAEAKKTFIGEPYERVMAYYYRGILYWRDGEPDNARACFRSAMIQDSDTTNKTYSADYALLEFLDALATAKMGDDGSDALNRAQKVARIASLPPFNPKANVLVFLDIGAGPTKYAVGEYNEILMFRPGRAPGNAILIKVGQGQITAVAEDDLFFQATTRGGRVMDQILANKAGFKRTTDVAGTGAIIGGAVIAGTGGSRGSTAAGLGLVAAGLFSKMLSASTTPAADIRSWDNLPLFLTFASLELPPGPQTLTIEFLDPSQRVVANLTKTVSIDVVPGKDSVIYVSDQSITPLTL